MTFDIYFGIPEVRDYWLKLQDKVAKGEANRSEAKFYKKLLKAFLLLQSNPRHNSLNSHEIEILSLRYGRKVWESYIESRKPAAGRFFWVYYPSGSITIIGIEPHPNDTKHSYDKITLSAS